MPRHSYRSLFVGVVFLGLITGSSACGGEPKVLYQKKSQYQTITVREEASGLRRLEFDDGAAQSEFDTKDPQRLVLSYVRSIMTSLAVVPEPKRILIVGLGGGSMPMFLRQTYPQAWIDCAELDPDVADVAKRFFTFREDERMKVHIGDGRKFIETTDNRYDIIYMDAYGKDQIPFSLATKEFLAAIRAKLAPGGIAVSNVWGPEDNKLYWSMVKTYREVFEELHNIHAPDSGNDLFIALPRKADLTKAKLLDMAGALKPETLRKLDVRHLIDVGYTPWAPMPADAKVLLDKDAPKD